MKERVRFAPSPTGPLHIGGLRTALFNYLYTKSRNGTFILRIEDTDRNRLVKNSDKYIEKALSWAGIIPDESPSLGGEYGPYRQSERISIYNEKIELLIAADKAYYAFDSDEELGRLRSEKEKKGLVFKYDYSTRCSLDNSLSMNGEDIATRIKKDSFVVRLKVNSGKTISEDLLRGPVRFDNSVLDDKILLKTDGFPTYHFANIVDDHLMKITTVIRGEEWLPSLPLHGLIHEAFGWEKPNYIHLPLILKPNGKGKLSKRDGTKGEFPIFPLSWEKNEGFKEMGFLSSGMINYLAMLGWNPGSGDEFFKLDDLIKLFNIKGVQKGGAKFDFEKAKWINQQHLLRLDFNEFEINFPERVIDLKNKYPSKCAEIFLLVRERLKLAGDFEKEIEFFLKDPADYDQKAINKLRSKNDVEVIIKEIEAVVEKNGVDGLKENLSSLSGNKNINFGSIMQLLRISLVGKLSGPDIVKVSVLIEKTLTLKRLANLKNHIKNNLS